jgi:hypothetical protein
MIFHHCSIYDAGQLEHPFTEDFILVCPSCWERLKGYAILSSREVEPDTQCKICNRTAGEILEARGKDKAIAYKQKEDPH